MEQDYEVNPNPDMEEVKRRFAQWRTERKRGTPIPEALWEEAIHLCVEHNVNKTSSALRLDYNKLKKRYQASCCYHRSSALTRADFISLDLPAPVSEYIVEMEHSGGRMKMQIKGTSVVSPVEVIKAFWGRL